MKKLKNIFPIIALIGLAGTFGFGVAFLSSTEEEKKGNGMKITVIVFISILAIGLLGTLITNPEATKG